MIGYRHDDGGRREAGYKGDAGDCTVRAAAILTCGPLYGGDRAYCYRDLYQLLARANKEISGKARSARNGVQDKAWRKVYADLGLVKINLPRGPKPTFTEAWERYGDCIVTTARHICAITGGRLRDTWDGRTYEWRNDYGGIDVHQRKAQSVFTLPEGA